MSGSRIRLEIRSESDVASACQQARALAEQLGFSRTERAHIVTAISEVAGNIWLYASRGRLELAPADEPSRIGLSVVAEDAGPGIASLELAMQDGYSTRGSMGLGLPGARRLMDDFEIDSEPGRGTTVSMARWRPKPGLEPPPQPLVDWGSAQTGAGRRAVVRTFPNGVLVAAVAARGRDREAELAAEIAATLLERHAGESPIALLERCHDELRASRGAAVALASYSQLDARMTWLGVGAVETFLVPARAEASGAGPSAAAPASAAAAARGSAAPCESAPVLPGLLGQRLSSLHAATVPVLRGDTLVLATGGVAAPPGAEPHTLRPPRQAAERLLPGGPGAALVLVARFLHGAHERQPPPSP